MSVRNRIKVIRLLEKIDRNTEYAKKIGISVNLKKDKNIK